VVTNVNTDNLSLGVRVRFDRLFQASVQQELDELAQRVQKKTVRNKICQVCGHISPLGFLIVHHIVPEHFIRQLDITDSKTVELCLGCHRAVHDLYARKTISIPYDPMTKRFRPKTVPEIAREYETTYEDFANSKRVSEKPLKFLR
jgi:hypothetical protein